LAAIAALSRRMSGLALRDRAPWEAQIDPTVGVVVHDSDMAEALPSLEKAI
jgi:hypothetical protein